MSKLRAQNEQKVKQYSCTACGCVRSESASATASASGNAAYVRIYTSFMCDVADDVLFFSVFFLRRSDNCAKAFHNGWRAADKQR